LLPLSADTSKCSAVTLSSTYFLIDCCVAKCVAESDDISSSSLTKPDVLTAVPAEFIMVSTLSLISSMCWAIGT